jgi:hypothetical protein
MKDEGRANSKISEIGVCDSGEESVMVFWVVMPCCLAGNYRCV